MINYIFLHIFTETAELFYRIPLWNYMFACPNMQLTYKSALMKARCIYDDETQNSYLHSKMGWEKREKHFSFLAAACDKKWNTWNNSESVSSPRVDTILCYIKMEKNSKERVVGTDDTF